MTELKLKILLLGPPAIYYGEQPLKISRRIVRAILFYLAGEQNFISRNRLISMFWPEESDSDGRRHLREILSKLRNELPDEDILIADQDRVGLDFQKVDVDLIEFVNSIRDHWSAFKQDRPKPLEAVIYRELDRLIFLWRSPRFMAGMNTPGIVGFENWVRKTGQTVENYRHQIMKILADDKACVGDVVTSLWWLKYAMDEDEFDPDLQFRYLSGLQQLGRTSEALDFYATLEKFYEEEGLGEIPSTLKELYKNIRSFSAPPETKTQFTWPGQLDLSIPFVGHQQLIKELKQCYRNGGSVILQGEAGSGKSRIAYELARQLSLHQRLVFAQGRAMESNLPFQPWIDALRSAVSQEDWGKLDPVHKGPLARLIPEFNSLGSQTNIQTSSKGEQGRTAVFEAIHQLLLGMAGNQRIAIFFDDAHWCDPSSLNVLSYLQERRFFDRHGFLLMAARIEEKRIALNEFLVHQQRPVTLQSYQLDLLGYSDIFQMADFVLGFAPSDAFVQRLMLDTGGNPLFLSETLHALQKLTLDANQINSVRNLPLSNSIRILIRERVKQLNDETRELLTTAAVMGNTFSTSILQWACGLSEDAYINAIEDLERIHLIQAVAEESTSNKYTFIHDTIRENLLQGISQVRMKHLHGKVAAALEKSGPTSQQAAVIAEHYQFAGNIPKAFHYWISAGEYAQYLLSPAESFQAFQNAEKLFLESEILLDVHEIHRLYITWAILLEERNDIQGLQACYNKLVDWGSKRREALLVSSGLIGLSNLEILKVNPIRAMEYIQEAEIYLAKTDEVYEICKLYNQKGMIFQLTSELDKAAEAYQKSLQISEGKLDPQVIGIRLQSMTRLALLEIFLANPRLALDTAQECVRMGNQLGSNLAIGWGCIMQATSHYAVDEYQLGVEIAQTGIHSAELIQNQHVLGYLYIGLAKNLLSLGRLKDSWDAVQKSLHIAREYNHLEVLSEAYVTLGNIFMNLRNFKKAHQVFEDGVAIHENNFQMFQNMLLSGLSLALEGESELSIERNNQVLAHTGKTGLNYIYYGGLFCNAFLSFIQGNLEESQEILKNVMDFNIQRRLHDQVYMCYWLSAMIHQKKNDLKFALEEAESTREIAQSIKNPWLEINALQLLIQLKQGKGCSTEKERTRILVDGIALAGIPDELVQDFNLFKLQVSS